jgi:hypothetical protein
MRYEHDDFRDHRESKDWSSQGFPVSFASGLLMLHNGVWMEDGEHRNGWRL